MAKPDLTHAVWRKSSRSNQTGQCVEVAMTASTIAVRDGKNPGQEPLIFTSAEWAGFVRGVKDGEFDV